MANPANKGAVPKQPPPTPRWVDFRRVTRPPGVTPLTIPDGDWSIEGLDPYLLWADATGYGGSAAAKATSLACLLQMRRTPAPPASIDASPGLELYSEWLKLDGNAYFNVLDRLQSQGYWITPAYLKPDKLRQDVFSATALIPKQHLLLLAHTQLTPGLRVTLSSPTTAFPANPPSVAAAIPIPDKDKIGGQGKVVVAVIDVGCPFAHRQFLASSGGTRVRYLWDQEFAPALGDPVWTAPVGFSYGREATGSRLDTLMGDARFRHSAGQLDEAALYSSMTYPGLPIATGFPGKLPAQYAAPMPRSTHGSAMLGLATGAPHPLKPTVIDSASQSDLIFVHLPHDVVRDTSGANLPQFVHDGLRYILDRVLQGTSLVVNLSYGAAAGAHDGTTLIEQYFSDAFGERPHDFMITVPAGNLRDARMHASLCIGAGGIGRLEWDVPAGSATHSYLECWPQALSGGTMPALQARIIPPLTNPATVPWVQVNQSIFLQQAYPKVPPGSPGCGAMYVDGPPNATKGSVLLFAVGPTDARQPGQAIAGRWTIEVENLSSDACELACWIQRNDPMFGNEGRQSRFAPKEPSVRNTSTLGEISNLECTVVVGGYVIGQRLPPLSPLPAGQDYAMSSYSSEGPTQSPCARVGPNVSAPADLSTVVPGLLVPATTGVGWVRMNGTSVATPLGSRALGNLMFGNSGLPATQLQTNLATSARPSTMTKPSSGGAGFLE